jgi:hypothetical protein
MALESSDKWRFTLYTTLIVAAIFNVYTYKLVHSLLSPVVGSIASGTGCPTTLGFVLHLVVLTLVLRGVMEL